MKDARAERNLGASGRQELGEVARKARKRALEPACVDERELEKDERGDELLARPLFAAHGRVDAVQGPRRVRGLAVRVAGDPPLQAEQSKGAGAEAVRNRRNTARFFVLLKGGKKSRIVNCAQERKNVEGVWYQILVVAGCRGLSPPETVPFLTKRF